MYFCNSLRTPDIAAKSFWIWGIAIYLERFEPCEFGDTPPDEMALPGNSFCLTPKKHFSIASSNPALGMHWKTARMFRVGSVALLAAIPISSTYCACWSALTTGSKYSRMKLEKADADLLRPCSSLL